MPIDFFGDYFGDYGAAYWGGGAESAVSALHPYGRVGEREYPAQDWRIVARTRIALPLPSITVRGTVHAPELIVVQEVQVAPRPLARGLRCLFR